VGRADGREDTSALRGPEIAFLGWLAWRFPGLRELLDEHLTDNHQEILPHLLIADYERWAEAAVAAKHPRKETETSSSTIG